MTPANTFIKAVEVWNPDPDGLLLEFGGGSFGPARAFATLSRSMCFGRGEGLPGRAWDEGRPVLLDHFENTYFRRTAAAHASGLTCAIAVPFFAADRIKAVLVIFCGHVPAQAGALELWYADSGEGAELALLDGAYGPATPDFQSVSRAASFRRGSGLPGLAWQQDRAMFVEKLDAPDGEFVRAAAARDAGLVRGLAIPAGSFGGGTYVITILAPATLPLAHRVERWAGAHAGEGLQRIYAFSELRGGCTSLAAKLPLAPGATCPTGAIPDAWFNGIPAINDQPASEPGPPAAAAAGCGANALLAIPVQRNGTTDEVLTLYL